MTTYVYLCRCSCCVAGRGDEGEGEGGVKERSAVFLKSAEVASIAGIPVNNIILGKSANDVCYTIFVHVHVHLHVLVVS